MHPLLHSLNQAQAQAVSSKPENTLVLAGAGSGKTRVLVHKIAWLVQELHYSPFSILAVTFTNKAAAEIKSRVENILQLPVNGMWLGTFHSLAHRLLRTHAVDAGLSKDFQIIDSEDQKKLVKKAIKALNLDEETYTPKESQWFINSKKDKGQRPKQISADNDEHIQTLLNIYEKYENLCEESNLIDFAELLLRVLELFSENEEIRTHYQGRFKYILVDEFQDTNTVQYKWLKLLVNQNNKMMIVGDDDQSIYGWRGAKVENINKFTKDFKDVCVIRLEQNYRSTSVILKAANKLIANNDERMGKNLWSEKESGEPIRIYAAFNEIDEAKFVKAQILTWVEQGGSRNEIAILYRSNAQSRVIEEQLIQAGIPYRVYGGMRFFERAEVKDALAYMQLIANQHNDAAFERVINHPNRGIGQRSLAVLRQYSQDNFCSMWDSAKNCVSDNLLTPKATGLVGSFLHMISMLKEASTTKDLSEIVDLVIKQSGLKLHLQTSNDEKSRQKLENLQELVSAAKNFVMDENQIDLSPLSHFLSHASLEAGDMQGESYQDCVQLMTMHSAKGLEFPLVFMIGVEEGLFPSQMSLDDPHRLQEERRLCYVGMTRAMQKLYMSYAEVRRLYGKEQYHRPSRFISEIGKDDVQEVRTKIQMKSPFTGVSVPKKTISKTHMSGFKLGQQVMHPKFGEGTILDIDGNDANARIRINFSNTGVKNLILSFAKLTPC